MIIQAKDIKGQLQFVDVVVYQPLPSSNPSEPRPALVLTSYSTQPSYSPYNPSSPGYPGSWNPPSSSPPWSSSPSYPPYSSPQYPSYPNPSSPPYSYPPYGPYPYPINPPQPTTAVIWPDWACSMFSKLHLSCNHAGSYGGYPGGSGGFRKWWPRAVPVQPPMHPSSPYYPSSPPYYPSSPPYYPSSPPYYPSSPPYNPSSPYYPSSPRYNPSSPPYYPSSSPQWPGQQVPPTSPPFYTGGFMGSRFGVRSPKVLGVDLRVTGGDVLPIQRHELEDCLMVVVLSIQMNTYMNT